MIRLDAVRPLLVVVRGLGSLATAAGRRWRALPRDHRGPVLLLVLAAGLLVALLPYGPWLAAGAVLAAAGGAGWHGERRARGRSAVQSAAGERLGLLYEALVPYFSAAGDTSPEPLYERGGDWRRSFPSVAFGADGRIERLVLTYPAFFPDGDPECRARVERLLAAKAGRGREFGFRWDEERNELAMAALEPLPAEIRAQRFVTSPGETVLGFTDAGAVDRTVPVLGGPEYGELLDACPVMWRTGPRSAEPHLLVVGVPGAGATSLLRSVALQALEHGDVLVVEGGGAAEFGCFAGRAGVVAVESAPGAAVAALEWAARETERRLLAGGEGRTVPRPLWIVVDRPALLGHLARIEGLRDPVRLLEVPLRFGRAVRVTVALAEHFEGLAGLGGAVLACARARVVLGAVTAGQVETVLGAAPGGSVTVATPPGRGFARLGAGPVYRLQVPATPDPGDEATDETLRRAVLALLPARVAGRGEPAAAGGGG
ncbi:hypothetical protein [Streptomyces sp. NBC_01803]|uniref:hypothetical protein n=1 Tax=Streptomyces sp. NBC_01803 TaxID=2975946 RepID=UPI002DD9D406|nr:hypothetical protein [Streptomyces sp. NBC_01803]WSA42839.1 hypothetical protein OIE51_00640 [Streptomyces sp. NBC_01803]